MWEKEKREVAKRPGYERKREGDNEISSVDKGEMIEMRSESF